MTDFEEKVDKNELDNSLKKDTLVDENQDSDSTNEKLQEDNQPDDDNQLKVDNQGNDNQDEELIGQDIEQKDNSEKKLNKNKIMSKFITINTLLIISSIIYFICKIYDPFKGISESDINNNSFIELTKYIIFASIIIGVIGFILLLVHLLKIKEIKLNIFDKINNVLDWLVIFPVCIMITSICFSFFFTFSEVDGDSMEPNFTSGEQVLLIYNDPIDRFDSVVVHVNNKYQSIIDDSLFIKRVIGLPGDTIEYILETDSNGNLVTWLMVNGERVEETFYSESELHRYQTYNFVFEEICSKNNLELVYVDGKVVIPDGYYLVLGDNRGVSKDSRIIGLINKDDIVGVVKYKVHSLFKYEKIE